MAFGTIGYPYLIPFSDWNAVANFIRHQTIAVINPRQCTFVCNLRNFAVN
jgi:hypothetical protein